ncbi:recombinase family protein [Candidatus Tisiphia endosymbiont of Micropterix aruncella]|uniref:recombinase family protein n=1 Tax=Candidatus Tisiphia endosymbiont of Micropterix aruncella TaxID=3066271 RepID=UPI003AA9A6CB
MQDDALIRARVDQCNIFKDQASGAKIKRTGLEEALNFLMKGDCLVVWKLDRLGRSLAHLIEIISQLKTRGISFSIIICNFIGFISLDCCKYFL